MAKKEVPDIIRIVLNHSPSALTAEEVHEVITENIAYEVSLRTVRETLRDLEQTDEIKTGSESDGTRGRPKNTYNIESSEEEEEWAEVERRGDMPAGPGDMKDNLPEGMFWDIVERQASSDDLVENIQEMALEFAEEDPVELLLEMVEWSVEELNEMGDELSRLLVAGRSDELGSLRDDYDDFAQWCDRYFHRFWRLTPKEDPGPDILHIPESSDFLDAASSGGELPEAEVNTENAENKLRQRVFGDQVITTEAVDESVTDAVGTDASVAQTTLPNRSPLGPDTTYQLFAGAAALEHEGRRFTDFDFNPSDIRDFRHREAFREGLIISPNTSHQLGEGEAEHAKYAAMDLRQYLEAKRVVDDEADWRPFGDMSGELTEYTGPDVLYLDGRLTPLVHQMADFTSRGLYGDLVRREIREFGKLTNYMQDGSWQTESVLSGVVKSPALSWLTNMAFWYHEVKHKEEDVDRSRVFRPPIRDDRLPHILFTGLAQNQGSPSDNEVYSTFRVLRRYYDHSIPENDLPPCDTEGEPIDVNSREEWMDFFEMVQNRKKNFDIETIDLEKFKTFGFAELCANVGTVMCYAGPPNIYQRDTYEQARLPRIEVLASPPADKADDMRKALSVFAQNNYPDDDHAFNRGESELEEVPVIVPGVIVRSDQVAKDYRDKLSDDIKRDILNIAGALKD